MPQSPVPRVIREEVAYNARVRKFYTRISEADLTNAVNGQAQDIAVGFLPPGAVLLRAPCVKLTTQFTGGGASSVGLTVGTAAAPTSVMTNFNLFGGTASGLYVDGTLGSLRQSPAGGLYLVARVTPNAGANLAALTAGIVELEVYWAQPDSKWS